MKRREFVTSLVVLGCASLVPLPKSNALTGDGFYRYVFHYGNCDLQQNLNLHMKFHQEVCKAVMLPKDYVTLEKIRAHSLLYKAYAKK